MEKSLHYLLMADHFIFQKMLFSEIKDTGLTIGQPKILDYLRDHDGTVQKDIAAACHIEQASLTSVLNGMEKKGLIERKMCSEDRRAFYVFLTEKGHELAGRIDSEFKDIEKTALKGFTCGEKKLLNDLLSRINENIK